MRGGVTEQTDETTKILSGQQMLWRRYMNRHGYNITSSFSDNDNQNDGKC